MGGKNSCFFMYSLLLVATTGFYSVTLLVFGQQPVFADADGVDIGQQPIVASPAQHGLVQSGGQGFGQQSGGASPAQHGLVLSSGQVFPQRLSVASPAQQGSVRPSGQASASKPAAAF